MVNLYIMETCPYCKKVMDFADKMGIEYNKKDIDILENRNELIKYGGKEQVPFMIDGEVSMYESDAIINYLKTKTEEQ